MVPVSFWILRRTLSISIRVYYKSLPSTSVAAFFLVPSTPSLYRTLARTMSVSVPVTPSEATSPDLMENAKVEAEEVQKEPDVSSVEFPAKKLTKSEKRSLRKAERKKYEKLKKRERKTERVLDPTINDTIKPVYIFENGLRKIEPYFYTYQTFCRGRWIGREILDVICSEFRYDTTENYATRLKQGLITVNGNIVSSIYRLRNGDVLSSRVHRHEIPVTASKVKIIVENEDFLVVDKPASIPVHPCGRFRHNSLIQLLANEMGYKNLRTIHRLDRATSGVLIFVKNINLTRKLANQMKDRVLVKEYLCRVSGEFPTTSSPVVVTAKLHCVSPKIGLMRVDEELGKTAETSFERVSYNGVSSVVKCIPKTGRTHQIRVHLQYLGYPILNDRFYNCPALWGSQNGKGGDYEGRTDVQLVDRSSRIHRVENYLEPEVYSNLLEEIRKGDGATMERGTAVGDLEDATQNETLNGFVSEGSPPEKKFKLEVGLIETTTTTTTQALTTELPPTITVETENGESTLDDEIKIPSPDVTACSLTPPSAPTADSSFDATCKDCLRPTRDPSPKELVMFLHAFRYSGPDFDFASEKPDWAREDWKDEDAWRI